MTRAPRGPKRSPTPTSATFPTADSMQQQSVPSSPIGSAPTKPLYLCSPFVEAALVKGNFKTIVMLPKYVDIMEWVAVNSKLHVLTLMHLSPQLSMRSPSIWLLHEPQRILRCYHRMLYAAVLFYNVCRSNVYHSYLIQSRMFSRQCCPIRLN